MPKLFLAVLALGLALLPAPLLAQSAALAVDGHVAHPAHLTLDQVKALTPITVSLTFDSDHGPQTGTYTGALLLDIVRQAAPMDKGSDKGAPWAHTILARGRDGYGVALAIGEIEPRFEGKKVIVAYQRDGKSMEGQTSALWCPATRMAAARSTIWCH